MVFPDYYFFAERRLVNHTIEKKGVNNLDDCELLCYLNDHCVSLNFEKDPENNRPLHICELNNATHLKYDSHLTTNATFYYRGSKVSYNYIITKINVYTNICVFDHSVFRFSFFFRTLVTRAPTAKITQLASLDLHSRDIGACVLLDSKENIVKRVWVQVNTWNERIWDFFLIFSAGMTSVL